MIIRLILILTMIALVLGGVGAAFVQAQPSGPDPATDSVTSANQDARHDDVQPDLEIVEVDLEDNVIMVKGAVPGPNGGYVIVRRAKR